MSAMELNNRKIEAINNYWEQNDLRRILNKVKCMIVLFSLVFEWIYPYLYIRNNYTTVILWVLKKLINILFVCVFRKLNSVHNNVIKIKILKR